jgi:hypothetical protein
MVMADDPIYPTVTQKLNSRTLWVTVVLLVAGLAVGYFFNGAWMPEAGKAMFDLGLFAAGIMVGKAGK